MEILLIEFLIVLKCITNSLQKIVFAAVDSTEIKNPLEAKLVSIFQTRGAPFNMLFDVDLL